VRLSEPVALSARQVALIERSRRYIPFLLLAVMIGFRSIDYPALLAFGFCIAIGIFLSASALVFLLASAPKPHARGRLHQRQVPNDLGFRIVLAAICVAIALFFDIYRQGAPYGLAIAAAVALIIPLIQYRLKMRTDDVDAMIGRYSLSEILLTLCLLLTVYSIFGKPASPLPAHLGIAVWATCYVAILRTWQMRQAIVLRAKERTP
jgi:hypothetical protein